MIFNSLDEVHQRLAGDDKPLSIDEIRELRIYARHIGEGNLRRIYVELALLNHEAALMNKDAIEQFDKSSSKFSARLLWLTVVLTVLTAILTWTTLIMAFGHPSS